MAQPPSLQTLDSSDLKRSSKKSFVETFLPQHAHRLHCLQLSGDERFSFAPRLIASFPRLQHLAIPSLEELIPTVPYRASYGRIASEVKTALTQHLRSVLPQITHLSLTKQCPYSLFGILARVENVEILSITGVHEDWYDWDLEEDPPRFRNYLPTLHTGAVMRKLRTLCISDMDGETFADIFSFLPPTTLSAVRTLHLHNVEGSSHIVDAVSTSLETLVFVRGPRYRQAPAYRPSISSVELPLLRNLFLHDVPTVSHVPVLSSAPRVEQLSLVFKSNVDLSGANDCAIFPLLNSLRHLTHLHFSVKPLPTGGIQPPLHTRFADALIAHCDSLNIFLECDRLPTPWQRLDERLTATLALATSRVRRAVDSESVEEAARIEELLAPLLAAMEQEGEGSEEKGDKK